MLSFRAEIIYCQVLKSPPFLENTRVPMGGTCRGGHSQTSVHMWGRQSFNATFCFIDQEAPILILGSFQSRDGAKTIHDIFKCSSLACWMCGFLCL